MAVRPIDLLIRAQDQSRAAFASAQASVEKLRRDSADAAAASRDMIASSIRFAKFVAIANAAVASGLMAKDLKGWYDDWGKSTEKNLEAQKRLDQHMRQIPFGVGKLIANTNELFGGLERIRAIEEDLQKKAELEKAVESARSAIKKAAADIENDLRLIGLKGPQLIAVQAQMELEKTQERIQDIRDLLKDASDEVTQELAPLIGELDRAARLRAARRLNDRPAGAAGDPNRVAAAETSRFLAGVGLQADRQLRVQQEISRNTGKQTHLSDDIIKLLREIVQRGTLGATFNAGVFR